MISIVTGTLNRRKVLPFLIQNTVERCDKLELVLLDGGSTDGSIDYIKGLEHPRINFIEIGKRSPYPHYMNLGIKASSHPWVCQWNDDVVLVNPWEDIIELLKKPFDVFIFAWGRTKKPPEDIKDKDIKGFKWIMFGDPKKELCMNFGIYRKAIFKKIGMYDSAFDYYYADRDLTQRARFFGYKIRACPEVKVLEFRMPKRALITKKGRNISDSNIRQYRNKKVPKTVEKLG